MSRRKNIRLTIAFDGTHYHGWQIQNRRPTVQGALRNAVLKVTGEETVIHGCGRTDAGTHARALVANFLTRSEIPSRNLVRALNTNLPRDIRVMSAKPVSQAFHARKSALSKIYRYQVYRGEILPPHLAREHFHYPYPLDLELMQRAARHFEGEHDFASFAASGAGAKGRENQGAGTVRRICRCVLKVSGRSLHLTVEGNGFLHHMVRNMAGTLLEVGRGRIQFRDFIELFSRRDRRLAGFTAPANGLILLRVRYPRGAG